MKNVVKFLAILSLAVGVRVYSKNSSHDDIKNQLIASCDGNDQCVDRVSERYDGCFEDAYTIGRHSRFDENQFMNCMKE